MTNPTFSTTQLTPGAGWVELAAGPSTAFLRVSKNVHHVPVFLFVGSSAPSLNPVAATGSVVFATGVPTAGQTVLIGSETYTFATLRAAAFQVTIGATNLVTATNFAAAVQSDSALVSAIDTSGTVALTAKALGTIGNYTVTTAATHVTATSLSGGALAVAGFRMETCDSHFDGAYSGNLYGRIITNSNDSVTVSVWQL